MAFTVPTHCVFIYCDKVYCYITCGATIWYDLLITGILEFDATRLFLVQHISLSHVAAFLNLRLQG